VFKLSWIDITSSQDCCSFRSSSSTEMPEAEPSIGRYGFNFHIDQVMDILQVFKVEGT